MMTWIGQPSPVEGAVGDRLAIVDDLIDAAGRRVSDGDVLVAPATTPAWTPLFARIVGVMTDTGSPMAHASLVAREYGIPAVVGAGDATRRFREGELITVDGSAGAAFIVR